MVLMAALLAIVAGAALSASAMSSASLIWIGTALTVMVMRATIDNNDRKRANRFMDNLL
jgi:hypothetical protein